MWTRGCPCVCVYMLLITTVAGAPDLATPWVRPQPQQTLHGLMVSIDERLHTLEITRWDTTLKQVEQRLDSLETTFRRLDTAFHDRLDKLERNLNSKELKDELTVEKLSHKVRDILDLSYDRYNRRLGYTEERLEMSFKKVQMTIEQSLNRIEKSQEDVQTEVLEAVTILEDLKSHSTTTEDKLNSTHKAIKQHIQNLMSPNHMELQRITGTLENLGSRLNNTWGVWGSQNDGPQVGDALTSLRKEINTEGSKFTSKINNMYNDLWRRIASVESLVKDLNKLGNMTQREVLEEVRSLINVERRDFPADSQENFMEVALDAMERKLQRKLVDLGRKLDDRLDTLSATQNLVMDSCFDGGICRGLESRLSQVLERIFDVFSDKIEGFSNRSSDVDSLVMEMMELVKTQHSQLIRTVTHNTNMVVTLAKDSSDATKLLHNSFTKLAEKTEYNFQELQDEVQEISNTSGKICTDSDKNNEENTVELKVPDVDKNNISEIKIVTLNTTQPTKNNTRKHHDAGVLKITTDDFNTLADNNTLAIPMTTGLKLTTDRSEDTSIMQIIGIISPNLTDSQIETLLQFLNSSVNLDNLEAIIQNTEAESEEEVVEDGASFEVFDTEFLNKTKARNITKAKNNKIIHGEVMEIGESVELFDEESLNKTNNRYYGNDTESNILSLLENSGGAGSIFEDSIDEPEQNELMDSSDNLNVSTIMVGSEAIVNINQTQKSPELYIDIKDQVKMYALLLKIKQGNYNNTELWKQIKKSSDQRRDQKSQNLLPLLQKLCYGEERCQDFKAVYINNVMRDRLLLINQTINDVNLYEKIENLCNTMTESIQSQYISEEILSED